MLRGVWLMVLEKSNLAWRCRRGIREMDLLLQRFMECRYSQLTDAEKQAFADLLEQPDLDIMDWIMGRSMSPTIFESIIEKLRVTNEPGSTQHT
jgi:antitoxin CptB